MHPVEQLVREGMPWVDRREIWEWAGGSKADGSDAKIDFGNTESFKGKYNINNVPWTREMLRAFKDPYVRMITFIAPPQISGKTKGAETCITWRIENVPAKIQFNTPTDVKAKKWYNTRWRQMMKATPSLETRLSEDRHDKTKKLIVFKDETFLMIQGVETEANRQSDTIEVQINDECQLWKTPWMEETHRRTNAYVDTKKILNIAVGGNEGSELHEYFKKGNQLEWHHHCPACSKPFAYIFNHKDPLNNIKFDLTKVIEKSDGNLDLRAFNESVYVECPHCKHQLRWSRELLFNLNLNGVHIPMNPDADRENVSLHINEFAIGVEPWHKILEPWVKLHVQSSVFSMESLKTFVVHTLAEFWKPKPIVVAKELKFGNFTRQDMLLKKWDKEVFRSMTVDNQRGAKGDVKHRWFVVRAWAMDGSSRLVDCGRINEWADVRAAQIRCGVPDYTENRRAIFTIVDQQYDGPDVQMQCALYKWFGALGQDTLDFVHGPNSQFAGRKMYFSEVKVVNLGFGKKREDGVLENQEAAYFLWSSENLQNILAMLRIGKGPAWELPHDLPEFCPQYAEHLSSHKQVFQKPDKFGEERLVWTKISGWSDHLYDCETMQCIIALRAGIIKKELTKDEK